MIATNLQKITRNLDWSLWYCEHELCQQFLLVIIPTVSTLIFVNTVEGLIWKRMLQGLNQSIQQEKCLEAILQVRVGKRFPRCHQMLYRRRLEGIEKERQQGGLSNYRNRTLHFNGS